jgi:ribulose kinase
VNVNNVSGGYVVGIDVGTLSGRALVVRVADGAELGTAVHEYRHRLRALRNRVRASLAAGPATEGGQR